MRHPYEDKLQQIDLSQLGQLVGVHPKVPNQLQSVPLHDQIQRGAETPPVTTLASLSTVISKSSSSAWKWEDARSR
jgi:hypothetical protein